MAERLVVGRVVSLEGGHPVIAVNSAGPGPSNGDRIAAMIIAARSWKAAKARHGLYSEQAKQAHEILLAAADGID